MNTLQTLKKHVLVDGFHVVADLEKSQGSWIVDAITGKKYLDCYSQFASQPVGWNYPPMKDYEANLGKVAMHKMANSDMYCETYAQFAEVFAEATSDFSHYFFIDGGALAVENALKAAFDWKHQKSSVTTQEMDIIHFKECFHGRTGYTMSLTNAGEIFGSDKNIKTKWFPKIKWSRVTNPKVYFEKTTDGFKEDIHRAKNLESIAFEEIENVLKKGKTAAIIIETIQGEGGDNHFRPKFFKKLRSFADEYEALLIFDEVQTGMGQTGKMWAYEHSEVVPDIMCFGKKTQVCGIASTTRIDDVKNNVFSVSGRINSTWGGNIVDMERCKIYLNLMKSNNLVEKASQVGEYFMKKLTNVVLRHEKVSNLRGKGLIIAFDLETSDMCDEVMTKLSENILVLKCGKKSIRFRPHLTFAETDVDQACSFIDIALS